MSRELILIPKLRYEQLLKQEQTPTNEKDPVSEQDLSEGRNTTVNQSPQQLKSDTLDNQQTEVISSKERGKKTNKTYQEQKTSKWWE